jgi:outer membrane cobalamin receptor
MKLVFMLLQVTGCAFWFALICFASESTAIAQSTNETTSSTNASPNQLPTVTVTGRQDSMLNVSTSASQGVVGADEIHARPLLRAGEILETVPGLIITQHAGGGKANQYFLRGFNLDHGTDFATDLDGMPLNLPSHAHGEGYSDMNVVIPELVEQIDYGKGSVNGIVIFSSIF